MLFLPVSQKTYKEQVLEPMLTGTEKTPSLITDYKEYHTDTTVKFIITMSEQKLVEAETIGLHKVFKLQSPLSCSNMVSNNSEGFYFCNKISIPRKSLICTHKCTHIQAIYIF